MHSQKCKKKQIIIFHVAELEAANSKMEMQIHLLTLRARIVVTFIVNDGDFFFSLFEQAKSNAYEREQQQKKQRKKRIIQRERKRKI